MIKDAQGPEYGYLYMRKSLIDYGIGRNQDS